MSKQTKIILVSAGVLVTAAIVLFFVSEDARKKKYNKTVVPPQYARDIINNIQQ